MHSIQVLRSMLICTCTCSESDAEESDVEDNCLEAIDNVYEAEDYCDDDDDADETWVAAETLEQSKYTNTK